MWATGERVGSPSRRSRATTTGSRPPTSSWPTDVRPGDRLLVDDGNVALVAVAVENGPDVVCDVVEGGMVSNNKGLSLPGVAVSVPALSEKDVEDLRFALQLGVDFVALSFVRSPGRRRAGARDHGPRTACAVPVIAKMEKPEAVERLEGSSLAFDGVMVARGDLGVELPLEQVPMVQKRAIADLPRATPSR